MGSVREVILHIGPGKTGTSALQSFFAANRQELARQGILYPWAPGVDAAATGETTAGNAQRFVRADGRATAAAPDQIAEEIEIALSEGRHTVLYSSESMESFDFVRSVQEATHELGLRTHVVYFVRSIFGHAISSYIEKLKAHQYARSLIEYVREDYRNHFWHIISMVGELDLKLTLCNYDTAKVDLSAEFSKRVLNIESDGLKRPPIVNPSMSPQEAIAFRTFNEHCARNNVPAVTSSEAIWNYLILAHTATATRIAPARVLDLLTERFADDVTRINKRMIDDPVSIEDQSYTYVDDATYNRLTLRNGAELLGYALFLSISARV